MAGVRNYSIILGALLTVSAAGCVEASAEEPHESGADGPVGKADGWFDDEPFADMYRTSASTTRLPIRGRLIEDDPEDIGALDLTPFSQVSQDEFDDAVVDLWLVTAQGEEFPIGEYTTDDEGYLDLLLDIEDLQVLPGEHSLEVWFEDALVGDTDVTLVDRARTEPVVRSDVDWTYLRTDFHGVSALTRLLFEDASEKETLPGMDLVYQGLRGDGARPLTFLSGSPRFFKRTLEAKAVLDDVEIDGLVLKPFKDIVSSNLLSHPTQILSDLKEQVGYKLYWLLRLRAELPPSTPEILMGDDSEADFVVYNLYTRLLRGELAGAQLGEALDEVAVSAYWRGRILELADGVVGAAPPLAIYINETDIPGDAFDLEAWRLEGLTRVHDGAWPLALDLYEEGWLVAEQVEAIEGRLLELGDDAAVLEERAARAAFLDDETRDRF